MHVEVRSPEKFAVDNLIPYLDEIVKPVKSSHESSRIARLLTISPGLVRAERSVGKSIEKRRDQLLRTPSCPATAQFVVVVPSNRRIAGHGPAPIKPI
ncbi:hypothetical protein J6590_036658 [Homalodisca vitripennis]|nr:hypothetical protein J6590_036658 [Homalodisca vitripennis]